MSSSIISFYAVGLIGLISALVVASSLNPILRIAYLILVFLSGSFIMITLDFYFLGLTYIIVYVGAIMILFLFVIMMVQIHLMPVSTSITPRIMDGKNHPNTLGYSESNNNSPVAALNDNCVSLAEGSIPRTRQGVYTGLTPTLAWPSLLFGSILLVPFLLLSIFSLFNPHTTGYKGGNMIVNYFFPSWFVEFKTMTDLETLANILYLGYPTALLLIGIALWAVLIGIIKVTASRS